MITDGLLRYLTLRTHRVYALPIVVLMPHSGCNCRCVMCDIWRGDRTRRLGRDDVEGLLVSLRQLRTRWVVISGGEALLNPELFELCGVLRSGGMRISVLSNGLLLERHARQLVEQTDELFVSLDGSETVHDAVRRVPGAYRRLRDGVRAVRALDGHFRIAGRCVIQRRNFADWPNVIEAAREIGLDQISFLPADVSSEAFNRPGLGGAAEREQICLSEEELPRLEAVVNSLIADHQPLFASRFIAESPERVRRIYAYFVALLGQGAFPRVRCNAPWVSAVIEADGTTRPCFFQPPMGNIRQARLPELLNCQGSVAFRRSLDVNTDPICRRCVCSLDLRPTARLLA